MTILAVVAYAGSERLVKMTERMLADLHAIISVGRSQIPFGVVAVNNAAERPIKTPVTWHAHNETNEGFGNAVNLAIRREIFDARKAKVTDHPTYTHVLVLNNDLEFPDTGWLFELLAEMDSKLVCSPCTDITATRECIQESAMDLDPIRCAQVSAFCWLVPVPVIEFIRKRYGFELFSPEFTNYGSDDITGAVLRKVVGPKPFKVVPRSWVRHKKAQTANELGVKSGTKELLQRISNWKRARRLA